jgi:serine/threonine-protein kinase
VVIAFYASRVAEKAHCGTRGAGLHAALRGAPPMRLVDNDRVERGNVQRGPEVGSVIAGKYRIDRTLAEGGMGVVVAATHIHLNQIVALKFLRRGVSSESDILARFTREARVAAQLRSEHVARVLDAGVTSDGTPYIAMEYLEGQSLARSLETLGPLEVPRAVEYMIQVCEGLAEAHARGIIHRDIKPDNLFLVERLPGWSAVKILDFGISKLAFAEGGNIATRIIMGSPCYMSPEQLRSTATVDHRTDIWSVGATLYELLAGRAAFDALQTLPELITAILHETVPEVHELRPAVPVELSAIIARCLANDRGERFESAGQLAMALLPFAPPRARVPAEMAASLKPRFRPGDPTSSDRPSMPISSPPSVSPPLPQAAPPRSVALSSEASGATEEPLQTSNDPVTPLALAVAEKELEPKKIGAPRPALTTTWVRVSIGFAAAIVLLLLLVRNRAGKTEGNLQTLAPAAPPQPVITREAPQPTTNTREAPQPASSAETSRVEIVVRASPPFAQITIDDRPVENPFVAAYPRDGATHRVAARAWGYEPKSEDVLFAKDTIINLGLNRRAPPASLAAAPASDLPKRAAAPIAAEVASRPSAVPSAHEVDPSGGRTPLRPIETKDPYGEP